MYIMGKSFKVRNIWVGNKNKTNLKRCFKNSLFGGDLLPSAVHSETRNLCGWLPQSPITCCLGVAANWNNAWTSEIPMEKCGRKSGRLWDMTCVGLFPVYHSHLTWTFTFLVVDSNLNLHFANYWEGGQPEVWRRLSRKAWIVRG